MAKAVIMPGLMLGCAIAFAWHSLSTTTQSEGAAAQQNSVPVAAPGDAQRLRDEIKAELKPRVAALAAILEKDRLRARQSRKFCVRMTFVRP